MLNSVVYSVRRKDFTKHERKAPDAVKSWKFHGYLYVLSKLWYVTSTNTVHMYLYCISALVRYMLKLVKTAKQHLTITHIRFSHSIFLLFFHFLTSCIRCVFDGWKSIFLVTEQSMGFFLVMAFWRSETCKLKDKLYLITRKYIHMYIYMYFPSLLCNRRASSCCSPHAGTSPFCPSFAESDPSLQSNTSCAGADCSPLGCLRIYPQWAGRWRSCSRSGEENWPEWKVKA